MYYSGIDVHKKYFISAVVDDRGQLLHKKRVSTDRPAIRKYLEELKTLGPVKAVMEAGFNWSYLYDELAEELEVVLAHPTKTRLIAEARIKTDELDAESLAHLLRTDLVAKAYAPSLATRDIKNLLRYRMFLVRIRTAIKNATHAVLDRNHIEDTLWRAQTDKFGRVGMGLMKGLSLKGNDTAILKGYIELIEDLTRKIKELDGRIKGLVKEDEVTLRLRTIPGIGNILALLVRYEIDDPERFTTPGKLASYAGLVPSLYSSGGKSYYGKITKQGNRWLRWAMTEAAQVASAVSPSLGSYYQKVKARRGANTATIALARNLLEIVYYVWKEKRPYFEKAHDSAVALSER